MFDWNDVRFLLAVADRGSTLAAARALGVNQSTVQRRVAELESRLGLRLIERLPSGYRLTAAGEALLPSARQIEMAVRAFERIAADAAHAGILRLTCPEPIALRLIQSGLLDRFRTRHPGVDVQFVLDDRYVDLSKGEADVALRSGDTDGVLIGRKIADSVWAAYASRAYVARHGTPATVADLASHPIIALDESLGGHRQLQWLRTVAPAAQFAARSNSVLGLVSAAKAGVGVAPLPIALGDAEPDLVQVIGPIPELTRAWRILAHPDNRENPKVDAFFKFMVSELPALKPIFTG